LSKSNPRIEIQGNSPFKLPSGVFEVEISICENKPSSESIIKKNFLTLWSDKFHLKTENGKFIETLGSDKNLIPESVFKIKSVWIVIRDQFSPINSVFNIKVGEDISLSPRTTKPKIETPEEFIPDSISHNISTKEKPRPKKICN